jgi:hypothetical protein
MTIQNDQGTDTDAHIRELLTRRELAERLSLSMRSIDNLQRARKISYIKLSPRCIRFHLPTVMKALRAYQVKAAGQ